MQIERDNFKPDTWRVCEGDKIYWVQLRRSAHGPSWSASVFVQPRSDQKPYWRPLRNWQRFAGAVRAFENNNWGPTMRDPKIDPREGDIVMATIGGRSVQRIVVSVVLAEPRADMTYRARNLRYTSNTRKGEHHCWITTWQDWCHKNGAEVLETAT